MKTDTEREREKYSAVWTDPAYAPRSPGLRHLPDALQWMQPESGASVTDWGSGSGQAADRLHESQTRCTWPWWTSPPTATKGSTACRSLFAAYGSCQRICRPPIWICCDVWNTCHRSIDEVVACLLAFKRTGKAVYFQIALFHDNTFTENGPLHLSVFPVDWWKEKLLQHFSAAEFKTIKVKHILAVCKP